MRSVSIPNEALTLRTRRVGASVVVEAVPAH